MNFDGFIKSKYEEMGILEEEYQNSNVIRDFFKNVKYASKGGKPASSPIISIKDKNDIQKLKNLTNPTYFVAREMLGLPDPNVRVSENVMHTDKKVKTEDQKRIPPRIAVNIVDILNSNALAGGSLKVNLISLIDTEPQGSTGEIGTRTISVSPNAYANVSKIAKDVLKKPLEMGILKWEEPKELSPKDLINKFVDVAAKYVGSTDAGIARM